MNQQNGGHWRRRLPLAILAAAFALAGAIPVFCLADDAAPCCPYLPLVRGAVWKYRHIVKIDAANPDTYIQTVAVAEPLVSNQQTVVPVGDELFLLRNNDLYLYGHRYDDKIVALEEPQKFLPAVPRTGDRWKLLLHGQNVSATCLGTQKVKVEVAEFDAKCIYYTTAPAADGSQSEIYRYYARNVGLVKETIIEKTSRPSGGFSNRVTTRELIFYSLAQPAATQTTQPADVQPPGGPNGGDPGALNASTLLNEGRDLANKRDHAAAIAKYAQALQLAPGRDDIHAAKAASHLALAQLPDAEAEIEQALKLNDKDHTYQEIAGQVKIAQGHIDAGQALYARAAAMAPQTAGTIYMDLAGVLASRNDDKLAAAIETALKAACAANPPNPEALFQLGQSYASAGRNDGRSYLQKYLEISAQLPESQRDPQKMQVARQMIRALDILRQQ